MRLLPLLTLFGYDSLIFKKRSLKCDSRRFLRYGVKFDIGALLTSNFFAVWRFIIFRQQEGMHASAFLRNKPKFLSSNEGMHAYSFLFDKQKITSEKDKNKPQSLGRFEIFFRGLIATFWHSRSHKIEVAVLGLLA